MPFPFLPVIAGTSLALKAGQAIFSKKNTPEDPAADPRNKLVADLMQRLDAGQGPVTDTAVFQSGAGELTRRLGDQAEVDAARATARGVAGTEFEIAQTGARNRALATGLRGLTSTAAGFQQSGQNALISQIGNLLGQQTQASLSVQQAEEQRRGRVGNSLGQALQAAVLANFHATQGAA